ncbi:Werner Syndrome-like exonuclease [Rhodamnia argentea]|uniref:Werner Syndrome-like exonuclease n=1 Tax=Rhodamnia argentea TaxID=178133 RepID=A0A8B8P5R5_9MYRT|nr:Werner Syndrome-like exonuclease [Rhodamnia argentea]
MTITIVDHGILFLLHDPYNLYDISFYGFRVRTVLTHSPTRASSWLSSRGSQPRLIGLDVQWRTDFGPDDNNPPVVLQLCVGTHCLIFQILHAPEIPQALADFLRNPRHVFVGVGIDQIVERLRCDYGLAVATAVDLRALAARELGREELRRAGLEELAREVLGRAIERLERVEGSQWENMLLSSVQVLHACLGALVPLQIGEALNAGGAQP